MNTDYLPEAAPRCGLFPAVVGQVGVRVNLERNSRAARKERQCAASLAMTEDESLDKNSFRVLADKFIKPQVRRGRTVKFNQKIPEVKEATFSAVISGPSKLWIVIYLTGSNLKYFQLSVSNAIFNVESANNSRIHSHIRGIYPLLNDAAIGYQPTHLQQRLTKLREVTGSPIIQWKNKEELTKFLMAA
jgi:hypothetical protein